MDKRSPNERENRFIGYLESIRDRKDRGALATLRRGLGHPPGMAHELHRYVAPFLPSDRWAWPEQTYYIIASLFAWHPMPGGEEDLGGAFRRVHQARGMSDSIEQRFVALLNSHRDDLHNYLRQAIGLARASDVPVDWRRLHSDIIFWDDESGRTRRKWAQSFWGR